MSGRPQRADDIEALLSDCVVYELWGPGDQAEIHPLEQPLVARAIDTRRAEFAAGRTCARLALSELGFAPAPILRGELRCPVWPPAATGSISHTDGYALAAVRRIGQPAVDVLVGLDAEHLGRVKPKLYRRLFTEAERAWLAGLGPRAETVATAMFGCKESFYKAQFVESSAWVGFQDVEVRCHAVDGGELAFDLHPVTDLPALGAFEWPVAARAVVKGTVVVSALEVRPFSFTPSR